MSTLTTGQKVLVVLCILQGIIWASAVRTDHPSGYLGCMRTGEGKQGQAIPWQLRAELAISS